MSQCVFADQAWYVERQEKEEQFVGVLEPVAPPSGPAGRPGLSFVLRRERAEDLPVYSAGIEPVLSALAGHRVSIQGKRIDFQRAGFEAELWIGEILLSDTQEP